MSSDRGVLYIVAGPIGNLGDVTERARATLCSVKTVAAEDTRRARILLDHVGSEAALVSYHASSPESRLESILEMLRSGNDIAVLTDAGTPAISDPGSELVDAARSSGIRVVPLPGPSAPTTLVSASGLRADRHVFLGFLPRKSGEKRSLLQSALATGFAVVFFESPGRLIKTLNEMAELVGPDTRIAVGRELTKLYEEIRVGNPSELAVYYGSAGEVRGEVTVLIEAGADCEVAPSAESLEEEARQLIADGMSRRDVVAKLSSETGVSRNEIYRMVQTL